MSSYKELLKQREALEQILAEQLHNGRDLFQRALPVLGGEGVEGHGRNAQLLAVVGDILKHGGTLFVARGAGQAPLLGPAAIAVHDDSNVTRDTARVRNGLRRATKQSDLSV